MAEKVKQEKNENKLEQIYQREIRKLEKINIAIIHGHAFTY